MRSTATFRAPRRSPGIAPILRWWTATAAFVFFCLAASSAWAISLRDIIQLSRAGVSDDVLIELIEIDETIFHLAPADLLDLKAAGVGDRVVIAMIRTVRIERERREQAEAQARYEAAETARVAVTAASYGGSSDTAYSSPATRLESRTVEVPVPVAVPVPVPVFVQQVVEVDRGRSRRPAAGGHQPPPASGVAGPAASTGRGADHDRRSEHDKKPYWIVNTSGWVVK